MGAKKTLPTYKLWDNYTVGDHVIADSDPTNITNLDNISIQFNYNTETIGLAADKLDVLVSNDNINYAPLSIPSMPSFENESNLTIILNLNQLAQPWIKLRFWNYETNNVYISATIFGKDLN